jgi:hypothetical protein
VPCCPTSLVSSPGVGEVGGASRGLVLVTVIVTCAALWALVAALALVALMHLRLAGATVARAEAERAWEARIEDARHLAPDAWPGHGDVVYGEDGACTWSWEVVDRRDDALVIRLRMRTPAFEVEREATLHAR